MAPPQSNAVITRVTGATAATGGRDDWDEPAGAEPAGAGPLKWQGEARAYYRERTYRLAAAGADDVLLSRQLVLETARLRELGLDTDDVLTVTLDSGPTFTGRAAVIEVRELAGIPAALQTSRLELELE